MGKHVLVLVGPTGVGKTAIAVELARRLDGEVVSADARQVYRGMDVGTAKPSIEETGAIPHHMLDVVKPGEYFSAGTYAEMARGVIEETQRRGKLPIVAGGSGLYVRALIDGLFDGPSRDDEIRTRLRDVVNTDGLQSLYGRLMKVDPDYAATISPNDQKRIIRALEVYESTGESMSIWFARQPPSPVIDAVIFGLRMEREELVKRIEERVDRMLDAGLVSEVKGLLTDGYGEALRTLPTIGYTEVIDHLDGKLTKDEMVGEIKKNTRRYAKRQMTWFRADDRIIWVNRREVGEAADEIEGRWLER